MFRAALLRRLLCLGMAFALLVPAAASGAHNLRHGPQVAAGIDQGSGMSHGAPVKDKHDGGHDHQLSLSVPVGILFSETPLDPPLIAVSPPPETRVKTLALRAAEPPPGHPPRSS